MPKISLILFIFIFVGLNFKAFSLIDPSTGDLQVSTSDLIFREKSNEFNLYRFYNQNAKTTGLLGSSWCFNIEQKILVADEGLSLVNCGLSSRILFLNQPQAKLKNNDKLYTWGKETLIKFGDDRGYLRFNDNNEVFNYNQEGYLTSIKNKNSPSDQITEFIYDEKSNVLQKIIFNKKFKFDFIFTKEKQLKEIVGPAQLKMTYSFNEAQYLSQVKNVWGNSYSYSYDNSNRLSHIQYPQKENEQFFYEAKFNSIVKTIDKEGCTTQFKYDFKTQQKKLDVIINNSCKPQPITYKYHRSPLFFKNMKTTQELAKEMQQQRAPTSLKDLEPELNPKPYKNSTFEMLVFKNENGLVSEIDFKDKELQQSTRVKLVYVNSKLMSLTAKGVKVDYVYDEHGQFMRAKTVSGLPSSSLYVQDIYAKYVTLRDQKE